jgi:hypothetical protein
MVKIIMNRQLLLSLLMFSASCQPDEVLIIRAKRNTQAVSTPFQPDAKVAEESKDCPPCEGNTYCNRRTGKCEAQAVSPVKRDYSLSNKPISVTAFYWQDKGGKDR